MKTLNELWTQKINLVRLMLLVFLGSAIMSAGQQPNLTESEIITSAQLLFDKKDYQAAIPLYAQLVSVHPDDPLYNYRFGVCTLFGDRRDKKKPIRYLNNAAQSIKNEKELFYYLAFAYHQNQEFANAMKYYNQYLSSLPQDAPERASILEKVNACLNGLSMGDKNLVAEFVSTSKFQKENFHRAYAAQDFNGSLMIKPDIFISDKESKSGENSYVYLVHPSNVLYFSGYSKNENSNRDIFMVEMDENGDWGTPVKLNETINTTFDEDYPVLVDNGNTLYFCSKGHNSLGGYDIFRSTLDPVTNNFSAPENLGPGINSPFDDIVFIPTKDKSYAYFSSDRDNLNGSINVFKVRLNDNAPESYKMLAFNELNQPESQNGKNSNSPESIKSDKSPDITNNQVHSNGKELVSDASRKAANMVSDRSKCTALSDSAFFVVTNTKNLMRDLANKRDRANAISQRKAEEVKTLEARLNESIAELTNAKSEAQFLDDLEKSILLKKEIYQLQRRSDEANKIAWNIGNQIKSKDAEFNYLKELAGKIQSTSVSGTFEETLLLFSNYKKVVVAGDTLSDYTAQLTAITNNQTTYDVPQSELLFAENLKKAYQNNTLLAEMTSKKPAIGGNVPIVVVDKRTGSQEIASNKQAQQKSIEALALIEPLDIAYLKADKIDAGSENLIIDFGIDSRTEPLKQVEMVSFMASNNFVPAVKDVPEINFTIDDQTFAVAQVEAINYSASGNISLTMNDEPEIDFVIDKTALATLYPVIEPVNTNVIQTHFEIEEISLALNHEIDAVEAFRLIEPVSVDFAANQSLIPEESIEIAFHWDHEVISKPAELVNPVLPDYLDHELMAFSEEPELNFDIDVFMTEKLITPVDLGQVAFNQVLAEENIEIQSDKNDFTAKSNLAYLVEPVVLKFDSEINIEFADLDLNFNIDQVKPEKTIEQVHYNLHADHSFETIEPVEINYNADNIPKSYPLVEMVLAINSLADHLKTESYPEIDFTIDQAETALLAEQIAMPQQSQNITGIDDIPEIIYGAEDEFSDTGIAVQTQEIIMEPGSNTLLAMNEEIELSFEADQVVASQLIQPVLLAFSEKDLSVTDIEINFNADKMDALPVVEYIAYNTPSGENLSPADEPLELSFNIDKAEIVAYPVTEMITIKDIAATGLSFESDLTLNFSIDREIETIADIDPIISENDNINDLAISEEIIVFNSEEGHLPLPKNITMSMEAKNSIALTKTGLNEDAKQKKINTREIASTDEIYFLREAVIQTKSIESSKSDEEILNRALQNPDELTYEELLYAANLTDNQQEKIAIYNVAFVHIDRDWRAFNNAAVSAIYLDELGQANCYLYQASLLSDNNGYVQNNMGILACRENKLKTAEEYFIAASNLGYDAQYNLNLISGLSDLAGAGNNISWDKVKNAEKNEDIIVDIIDYNASGK